jgi:hypothetical protein
MGDHTIWLRPLTAQYTNMKRHRGTTWHKYQRRMVIHHIDHEDWDRGDLWNFYSSSILTQLIARQDFSTIIKSGCLKRKQSLQAESRLKGKWLDSLKKSIRISCKGSLCVGLQQQKVVDVAIILPAYFWKWNCAVLGIHWLYCMVSFCFRILLANTRSIICRSYSVHEPWCYHFPLSRLPLCYNLSFDKAPRPGAKDASGP